MKNSFILYNEHVEIIKQLTDEQAGQIFKAIFEYQLTETNPDLGPLLNIAFTPIRLSLDKNNEKYQAMCQRNAKNGEKGGRPKKSNGLTERQSVIAETKENPTEPKKADNDNDYDYDNENEYEQDNENENILTVVSDESDEKKGNTNPSAVNPAVLAIYNHWNAKRIVVHQSLTSGIEKAIQKAIKKRTPDRIKTLIDRYAQAINDSSHFFDYKWTLENFLKQKNGIDSFDDEGDKWINYLDNQRNQQDKADPFASTQIPRDDDPFALIEFDGGERMQK